MVSTSPPDRELNGTNYLALRPLLRELNDLKRIRVCGSTLSLAAMGFERSWRMLLAGDDLEVGASREAANALAAVRLGGIDQAVLSRAGLDTEAILEVLRRSFDAVSGPLELNLSSSLRSTLNGDPSDVAVDVELPRFVKALTDQPRAGATCPGRPRLILEPPESHADHCYITAVYAVVFGGSSVSNYGRPFLTGLTHHLHNAILPDSGFAGEEMLGGHLTPIVDRLTTEALESLPDAIAGLVRETLELTGHVETAEAQAFHAADVLDRVLQMDHYARAASFSIDMALEEMELVHEGPLQAFQNDILYRAGLRR